MLHFLINPHAKNIAKLLGEIAERLNAQQIAFDFHTGETKEEMRRIAHELTQEPATVIAVGGDGTLNDVLCGICPENTTLGIIPTGTGNDFAASAGIPGGIAALDLILSGEAKPTDYIECGDGLRSLNIAGLGIDVDILERCYRMKRGGRRSKYFFSLLAALFRYKGQQIEVTVDGETFRENAFIAAVCNGRQFGAGIPICPPAVIDDGKLEFILLTTPKRWRYPILLIKLVQGKILNDPIARRISCEEARLVQIGGKTVELDGELISSRSLSARVVHGALRIFRG